jgi:hypothetical protein
MALRAGGHGVRAADLAAQRTALIEFAEEMYGSLARCDQRAKGEQYVRGLLLEGRRKSIQPMAARLADGDEQGLQQFITDSPWEDLPVRRRLARRMTAEIEPEGWVIDDTGVPKDGRFSPGVAHQYCGALGKTANCQVLVSVNAATDRASCPLGWRLFLPEAWDADAERRKRARIPDDVRHVPKWQLALEIVDELIAWGLERRVVQADGGYGDITAFRVGLEERELSYVVQVKGATSAQPADAVPVTPAYRGTGRPPVARYPGKPKSLRDLVRPPAAKRSARSAGAKATAARSQAASSRSGSGRPTMPNAARMACCRSAGYWPNGPRARTSPSSTGSATCPPTRRYRRSCGPPSCAGASSTTTASSNSASALTTTKAVPTAAYITTSHASPSRTRS